MNSIYRRSDPNPNLAVDYTGETLGTQLTALNRHDQWGSWLWRCTCGKTRVLRPSLVRDHKVTSCGRCDAAALPPPAPLPPGTAVDHTVEVVLWKISEFRSASVALKAIDKQLAALQQAVLLSGNRAAAWTFLRRAALRTKQALVAIDAATPNGPCLKCHGVSPFCTGKDGESCGGLQAKNRKSPNRKASKRFR